MIIKFTNHFTIAEANSAIELHVAYKMVKTESRSLRKPVLAIYQNYTTFINNLIESPFPV